MSIYQDRIDTPFQFMERVLAKSLCMPLVDLKGRWGSFSPFYNAYNASLKEKRREGARGAASFLMWMFLAGGFSSWFADANVTHVDVAIRLTFFTSALVCFVYWLYLVFLRARLAENYRTSELEYAKNAMQYIDSYNWLLRETDPKNIRIYDLSLNQLKAVAGNLLIERAEWVLKFEKENEGSPEEHWREAKKPLVASFETAYDHLYKLGLVEDYRKFGRYYDMARIKMNPPKPLTGEASQDAPERKDQQV
ncbi:MAG: hypothetical protein ABA06_01725 [Parcubacteria bacterium C7867-001]|nr:MAG: hypothetical protein ABA06_01725 [Parcubacteria bacterium C7867-001]